MDQAQVKAREAEEFTLTVTRREGILIMAALMAVNSVASPGDPKRIEIGVLALKIEALVFARKDR